MPYYGVMVNERRKTMKKLSKAQKRVVENMADGYELRGGGYMARLEKFISMPGVGKSEGYTHGIDVRPATVRCLEEAGAIREIPKREGDADFVRRYELAV